MAELKPFDKDVSVHQKMGDNPNTDNNLSADAIKAAFDRPAEDIKAYLNDIIVPAVNANTNDIAEVKKTTPAPAGGTFVAHYGVTTFAAIRNAALSNVCFCRGSGFTFPLVLNTGSSIVFAGVANPVDGIIMGYSVDSSNVWTTRTTVYKKTGTIDGNSTDDQIPTAKAVYDAMQELEQKIAENGGQSGPQTETVLSDNLFDKTAAIAGQLFYHSSSGPQLVDSTDVCWAYVPLRGAGTYRTKVNAQEHANRASWVPILAEDKAFIQNVTGTVTETGNKYAADLEFTITEEMVENGAALYAFDCHATILDTVMIVKDREYPSAYIPYGYIEVEVDAGTLGDKLNNVLKGKTVVAFGDSICAGTTVGDDSQYYGYGWVGLIGETNKMVWKNYGRNGGTITPIESVAEERWIGTQVGLAAEEFPDADYILIEGGCNDADLLGADGMGVFSASGYTIDGDYEIGMSFTAAFETLLENVACQWPQAKIFYIIPPKMCVQNDYSAAGHIHRRFFDRAAEVCKKWGVPVLDLWHSSPLNPSLPNADLFYTDGQHLTLAGYQEIAPRIEAFMRSPSGVAACADDMPDYWAEYLEAKLPAIREKIVAGGANSECFMYFTDHHIGCVNNLDNANNTRHIIDFVRMNTPIQKAFFGGDILSTTASQTREHALRWLWAFHDDYIRRGVYPVVGNHEIKQYDTSGNHMTVEEVYSILFRDVEQTADTGRKLYYFVDNPSQKLRYIVLDSESEAISGNTAQLQWFIDALASMADGWTAVMFAHNFSYVTAYGNPTNPIITQIAGAYNKRSSGSSGDVAWDFAAASGEVACLICGHIHLDGSGVNNGILVINVTTDCGANVDQAHPDNDNGANRRAGDVSEQAVELFFVNTAEKTIRTVRLGYGEDREWNYESGVQKVNPFDEAAVILGAPGNLQGDNPSLNYYFESGLGQATLNPVFFYVEAGSTLNVSLSDYSGYGFAVHRYSCDESAKNVDFSVTEGTSKNFGVAASKEYDSGWQWADFSMEIPEVCTIAFVFRKKDYSALTADDTAAIKNLLTATVTTPSV